MMDNLPMRGTDLEFATILRNTTVAGSGVAFIGRVFIADGSASKILSAAGGGSISWLAGIISVTATTAIHAFGIQDVNTAVGPPGKPDGTYDVSATITGSGGAVYSSSNWNTTAMTSGAKTLSHGEFYAFVQTMVSSASVGGLRLRGWDSAGSPSPAMTTYAVTFSATVATALASATNPNVLFNCDDGTLAWLQGAPAVSSLTSVSISSGGTNNEYGMRFVLPWTSTVDELGVMVGASSAADYTVVLYSDPDVTPVTITAIPVLAETHSTVSALTWQAIPLREPVTITASTTYLLGIRADAATAVIFQCMEFAAAANKITVPAGGSLARGARGGGAGAFSVDETRIPVGFNVRIHQIAAGGATTVTTTTTTTITVTVGGAASMLVHPGMTGGVRG